MSVQVVAAKMAEVELKDVPAGKELPMKSALSPTSDGKGVGRNEPHEAGSSAAASPSVESSAKAGESSLGLLTPNPAKMPQASAMKRTDPQENGGEAFVNRDGTVAEAPRMKKVGRKRDNHFILVIAAYMLADIEAPRRIGSSVALCDDANRLTPNQKLIRRCHFWTVFMMLAANKAVKNVLVVNRLKLSSFTV